MPKRTSVVSRAPIRVALVTLDGHLASAAARATETLRRRLPGLSLTLHCAGEWGERPEQLAACKAAVAEADIVVSCMLFLDEHVQAIAEDLKARRDKCDAMVCFMCDGEIIRQTRMGSFDMSTKASGPLALLKKLRGSKKKTESGGAKQMAMLRRLPRILKFIPGTAQDVRAYFLTLQYWLAGSEENIGNLVLSLVERYAQPDGEVLRGKLKAAAPVTYPEVGLYHPKLRQGVTDKLSELPRRGKHGTVGVLLMRAYVLAGNARHYDAVIESLEARGLRVVPAFASGLDARPAVDQFFRHKDGTPKVDAVLSLTGFSLVGGPAYNDAAAASELLKSLDVPYLAAHATEFQTIEQWETSPRGLLPVETTMMVAIPELDGATAPTLFAGRSEDNPPDQARDLQPLAGRIGRLTDRVARLVALRRKTRAERTVAIVLFNFPPNAGATGSAAYLAVFESLFNTLKSLQAAGYTVDLPASVDALRDSVIEGNAGDYGTEANVLEQVPVDDYVRSEPYLKEIEEQWGPAPGRQQANSRGIFVLGCRFGNVLVTVQPAFGYEGDPMRLLFEGGHAPTHAFSAFYRYLRLTAGADAVLHFGTHGALEFMPGKQVGLDDGCWPERLLGDLPNFYLYAANNPSEGAIAKRRSAATLISYLTPPVTHAGLYRQLQDLKATLERWRTLDPDATDERASLTRLLQEQAADLELAPAQPVWNEAEAEDAVVSLIAALNEYEQTLIPEGLHVVGEAASDDERESLLLAMANLAHGADLSVEQLRDLLANNVDTAAAGLDDAALAVLRSTDQALRQDTEMDAIVRALDGGFIPPVVGGDLLKTPDILPTGRNLHGFDPMRIPSPFAVAEGARQTELLLERHQESAADIPESVAFVLWGSDNLKSEGGPIGQVLALLGARPRHDGYGRVCGAELIDLETLGRPRIDVLMTLSGIFRDLMPQQTQMLAEAAFLAASADEPPEMNFVRKHALAYQAESGCDLETAALRVFSNADGAYGSNVNFMIDNGRWDDEDELAEAYSRRKCFAFGRNGRPRREPEMLNRSLADVDIAYQNLESMELGVTSVDHYFDSLGGITRAAKRASGRDVEVYIGDQTGGREAVRTLSEQVALETHTRALNPKWYEGLLKHGFEGVRQIESHVTNTMGLSATTGKVAPWVYQKLTQLYVLDEEMRERLAELNPAASARMAGRLLEAHERDYWTPDEETLEQLRRAGDELDDRLEGINKVAVA
ncbi:MAG: magnesium chelatase subunit H [Pseudomonadota bacterium]